MPKNSFARPHSKQGYSNKQFSRDLKAHNRMMEELYNEPNIGAIKNIKWIEDNRPNYQLATDSQDVTMIYNDILTTSEQKMVQDDYPDLEGFSFFIAPDYSQIWVFSGIVPEYSRNATRIR